MGNAVNLRAELAISALLRTYESSREPLIREKLRELSEYKL